MQLFPIPTAILSEGDNLADILSLHSDIRDGDIIVVSSKAIATVEGAAIRLDTITPSEKAIELAKGHVKSAAYYQVVLDETTRMNGKIIQSIHGIVLTELKPNGLSEGSILVPNAGLDQSNVAEGSVIGWPKDPVRSAKELQERIQKVQRVQRSSDSFTIGIIITDSGLCPRRKGVTAFALCVSGIHSFISMIGEPDLFGNAMSVTEEAVADQLATAANFIMGNTNQSTPAVIIREHGLKLSDYSGWVDGIDREKDLYHQVI